LCYEYYVLSIVLAALSAAVWGTGDFCGGKASQKSSALTVSVASQLFGLPVLVLGVVAMGHRRIDLSQMGLGALGGIAGFLGIVLLYRGLARGAMAVFAPTSAVTSAVIPLAVGLIFDKAPSMLGLVGAVCAIAAIGLVSMGGKGINRAVTPGLIGLALATGSMFGIFFALLGTTTPDTGLWPLVGVRIGSIGVGLITVLVTRTSLRLPPGPRRWTMTAGALDITANAMYVLALGAGGVLSIIAPVASLYPVSTTLLALTVDKERVRPIQLAGLGLAATALVLVAT
jgi:drug/metabolite transporter (DMT)-like permease